MTEQKEKYADTKMQRPGVRKLISQLTRWWWLIAVAVCLVALVVLVKQCEKHPPVQLQVERNEHIDATPMEVKAIKDVAQWEMLSVSTEEMVEWHAHHTFSTDHLVRIYQGTLRLGVDMRQAADDWFTLLPDSSVRLLLPPIALLDSNFIDETRTRSFYEKGTVSPKVLDNLYEQAKAQMIKRCVTPQNIHIAQEKAQSEFTRIFNNLGFQRVSITFSSSKP